MEIQSALLLGRGAVLHASGVSLLGQGVAVIAPGGGGKSTLATTLAANGWRILSDDRSVVCRGSDGRYLLFPAPGDSIWRENPPAESAKLSAIILVEKSTNLLVRKHSLRYGCYRILRDRQIWPDRERLLGKIEERSAAREDLRKIAESVSMVTAAYNSMSERQGEELSEWLRRNLIGSTSI